jgi:hypothetical protein
MNAVGLGWFLGSARFLTHSLTHSLTQRAAAPVAASSGTSSAAAAAANPIDASAMAWPSLDEAQKARRLSPRVFFSSSGPFVQALLPPLLI